MKVVLLNGSPRANGNTNRALEEIVCQLEKEGVEGEILQLGAGPLRDCIGCNACGKLGHCVFDDDVINEIAEKMKAADGIIVGTPVYYAHPSGRILSALDRIFYSNSKSLAHKPGAAVAIARRAGTTASVDVLNKYFTIAQMPLVSSTYWNVAFGQAPGEVEMDTEGQKTMRNLATNMAWMLKCIEAGKQAGIDIPTAETGSSMNFIR